jgi:hypothetical protein
MIEAECRELVAHLRRLEAVVSQPVAERERPLSVEQLPRSG